MGQISVAIRGKSLFSREIDVAERDHIEATIERLANQANATPEEYVEGIVRLIMERGRFVTSDQVWQMFAVIYYLLQRPTEQ